MRAPLRFWRARGVAVVLAAGAAISLTAITGVTGGMIPAVADPITTTYAPVPTYAPETTYAPTTAAPATTYAPETTYAPTTAPQVTTYAPTTVETPVVTTPAPVVTTTAAPAVTTTAAPAVTTTVAPAVTTTVAPAVPTTAAPAVTTTVPVVTTQAQLPTPTGALPTPTGALPTPTGAVLPTATGALPTPTGAVLPTATGALPTPTGALPTPTGALPTPTGALPTPTGAVLPTATTAVQAAQVTPTETPKTLQAAPEDLELAKAAVPVQLNPPPAPQTEVQRLTTLLTNPANGPTTTAPNLAAAQTNIVQFPQVQYDEFLRPVILNPFRDPLQVVYQYAGAPRILVIPPLASAITEIAQAGAYNFTAMVLNAAGVPAQVAVGSMFGGGYVPAPGQPPPAPPPIVKYNDVPVQVKYSNATYKPFVVRKIVDVGDDPVVGERKVLLDGVTPAWGQWTQTESGDRQFEVHKTQQFPGMDDPPAEGPLPGDYQLQLASASQPANKGMGTKDLLLIGAAAVVLLLGIGAIVLNVVLGRRRRPHH